MNWSPAEIGDLSGKRFLVTGVTSGIGTRTAAELAQRGAEVVLAARSRDKLDATRDELLESLPQAQLRELIVDLSDLESVRRAAAEAESLGPLDVLVNNAGVMATAEARTADGLDLQMATNHFGPFLLTGLLLPQLAASASGRVVTVASQAHRLARKAPLDDPRVAPARHARWRTYARTKLANLLFVYELDRRLREAGLPVKALAAHPGYTSTELMATGRQGERTASILQGAFELLGQPAEMGSWPTLMAATADLPGSTYVGPEGRAEFRGAPVIVASSRLSHDAAAQRTLWEISQDVTGIRYP